MKWPPFWQENITIPWSHTIVFKCEANLMAMYAKPKREKAKGENWNRQGFYVNMPLDFLGLARTRLFEGLVPQTQNTKLVRNSLETEPLLYCIKCNTVEVQKLNRTQKNLVSVWTEFNCLCPLWKSTTCSTHMASFYANLLEQQQQQREQ